MVGDGVNDAPALRLRPVELRSVRERMSRSRRLGDSQKDRPADVPDALVLPGVCSAESSRICSGR